MSEDKMREEFEKTHAHIYHQFDRRHSGNYTNSFIQAKWEAWKACAAIKNAEIAELQKLNVANILMRVVPDLDGHGHEEYAKSVDDVENLLSKLSSEVEDYELGIKIAPGIQNRIDKEIAARDLMIKELREVIQQMLDAQRLSTKYAPDNVEEAEKQLDRIKKAGIAAREALAKSEHHNSRALDPDDVAVDAFAYSMKAKLAIKRSQGKSGWRDKLVCSNQFLSDELVKHVAKGDPVDVANFCMMLQQRDERIEPSEIVAPSELEKMLLEARIDELEDLEPVSSINICRVVSILEAKLSELNKE